MSNGGTVITDTAFASVALMKTLKSTANNMRVIAMAWPVFTTQSRCQMISEMDEILSNYRSQSFEKFKFAMSNVDQSVLQNEIEVLKKCLFVCEPNDEWFFQERLKFVESKIKFSGDDVYSIECTGDACVGDEVKFSRAIFDGTYPNSIFIGFDLVSAVVVADSYGKEKQQHTFTLAKPDGTKIRIKGRNLYRNRCFRKPWPNESDRVDVIREKHRRGGEARKARQCRKDREMAWKPEQ